MSSTVINDLLLHNYPTLALNMNKVVIQILQGSVVTQTVLGRLTIHPPVANFLHGTSAKNYENWLSE